MKDHPTPLENFKGLSRSVWHFRPPAEGDFMRMMDEECLITAEFGVRSDLSETWEEGAISDIVREANPDETKTRVKSMSSQLHALVNRMQPGDIVLCSAWNPARYHVGLVLPHLAEDRDGRPARVLEWIRRDIPKSSLLPDMIHSTGSVTHISEIRVDRALDRIKALLEKGQDPGPEAFQPEDGGFCMDDFIKMSRASIKQRIGSIFAGHRMADLVKAILEIEGMRVSISPPGPDGGIDLRAGSGPLGLGSPRIVGQIKSGSQTAGDDVLQSIVGNMHAMGADAVLLVSWSGLTRSAYSRASAMGFAIQVWDQDAITDRFIQDYSRLPESIRSLLPLNEVRILVPG